MTGRSLVVIGGIFVLGALLILAIGLRPSRRTLAEELRRLYLLELCLVGFVLLPAYAGSIPFVLAMGILNWQAQGELLEALLPGQPRHRRRIMQVVGASLVGLVPVLGDGLALRLPVLLVQGGLLLDLCRKTRPPRAPQIARAAFSLIYPSLFVGHLLLLRGLPGGPVLLAFLYVVVETCDSFALLCGKVFGRTPAFPELSPSKTREGVLGGVVAGGLAGLAFGFAVTPFPRSMVLAATGTGLAGALLGDLAASKLKRNLGRKDFGDAMGAHGGVLDVYDTLVFAAPPFLWLIGVTGS